MKNIIFGICLGILASCSAAKLWSPGRLSELTLLPNIKEGGLMYPYCEKRKFFSKKCKEGHKKTKKFIIKGNKSLKNFICKDIKREW